MRTGILWSNFDIDLDVAHEVMHFIDEQEERDFDLDAIVSSVGCDVKVAKTILYVLLSFGEIVCREVTEDDHMILAKRQGLVAKCSYPGCDNVSRPPSLFCPYHKGMGNADNMLVSDYPIEGAVTHRPSTKSDGE